MWNNEYIESCIEEMLEYDDTYDDWEDRRYFPLDFEEIKAQVVPTDDFDYDQVEVVKGEAILALDLDEFTVVKLMIPVPLELEDIREYHTEEKEQGLQILPILEPVMDRMKSPGFIWVEDPSDEILDGLENLVVYRDSETDEGFLMVRR